MTDNTETEARWLPIELASGRDGTKIWGYRACLNDPGWWVAPLTRDDGHWVDGNSQAFEPHMFQPRADGDRRPLYPPETDQ